MHALSIVALTVLACVGYGILHDQFTARLCVEYFTIGHPPIFGTEDPTWLALGWGVVATWWVGVLLGVPLAFAARFGRRPQRTAVSLVRPMLCLLIANGVFAGLAGVAGFVAASQGWVRLVGRLATAVPPDRHVPFLVDLWMHEASYLGGFLGGTALVVFVWRSR